jgi:ribosomal subunit interface protein
MRLPLEITFRDMQHSDAIEASIRKHAEKLDQFYDRIMACRVMIEAPHAHKHQGKIYHVRVELTVPGQELVASRSPGEHHAHEDIYVAIRDAFHGVQRQLQDFKRQQEGQVKAHVVPPHGHVTALVPDEDYGKILSSDGREIYFHRNSVVQGDYEDLEIGSEVRFVEEMGDLGPQATSVYVEGKHHVLNSRP